LVHSAAAVSRIAPVGLMTLAKLSRAKLPLNALRAFEAVAQAGSFRAGAERLGVTQSAASRHVAILEEMIGKPLFTRHARGIGLTAEGERLLVAARRGFDILQDGIEALRGSPTLRVHMPPTFLQAGAMPFLKDFRQQNPEIHVMVMSSFGEGLTSDGYDLAVVFDACGRETAYRELLWEIELTPVCSVDHVADFRKSGLASALASAELLHVQIPHQPTDLLWKRFAARYGHQLKNDRGLVFESMSLAVEFAAQGSGLALADVDMFAPQIAQGAIATPFANRATVGYAYYLQVEPAALGNSAIRIFRNSIVEAVRLRRARAG